MDDAGDDVVLLDYEFDYIIEEDDAAHADGDELDYSGTDSDVLPKLIFGVSRYASSYFLHPTTNPNIINIVINFLFIFKSYYSRLILFE